MRGSTEANMCPLQRGTKSTVFPMQLCQAVDHSTNSSHGQPPELLGYYSSSCMDLSHSPYVVPSSFQNLIYPLEYSCPMPTLWPQSCGQGGCRTGRDAAPKAVSNVTYHACSSSAPLPALAHRGCPGKCCGSSHTRPAAPGLEESSIRRNTEGVLGAAMSRDEHP